MDVEGLIALWRRLEDGEVRFHHVDTTEASPLSHEILTAKPYAFLDDGEANERRTLAVPLRRGIPVDPGQMGRLDPDAIAQVRAELTPSPRTADELHDLLCDTVLLRARADWQPLFDELAARGRAMSVAGEHGTVRWYAAECAAMVEVLGSGTPSGEVTPEHVAATMLRGHLELCSPATGDTLAGRTGLSPTLLAVGLATLEAEGSVIQGRFCDPDGAEVEWCARRLLARMHGLSRARRRKSVESVSPEDFMRFLTRWHHVAPGSRVTGPAGLATVLEQLQGWEAAVASWEPDLLGARLRDYQPGWLDRMCHDGELQWMRLHPACPDDVDRRSSGPSKATPVSLVYRDELGWLLPAFRGAAVPPRPTVGAVAEIIEAIEANGPRFLTDLASDTGRLPTDIESALWEGVARGLFTADGFAAIRTLTSGPKRPDRRERALSKLRRSGVRAAHAAGRWSLVPDPAAPEDRDELVEALADQLLVTLGRPVLRPRRPREARRALA
jgi:ATP-dependent helicase Lhr and Lhr-like helicase